MRTVTDTWLEYEKMVFSRCWSFHYSTGVDFDEFLSIAREKFMHIYKKYNKKNSVEFGKILYISLTNAFKDKTHEQKFAEIPEGYEISTCDPDQMWFEDFTNTLSEESAYAVKEILKKGLKTRTECSNMMRIDLNYSYPTVWKCMREIKYILSNF